MNNLTPKKIVQELDKHIIGQQNAKRAIAIAHRNRYRRMLVDDNIRNEITPKNILMIGPTGVGKTEIARRISVLTEAPFIKVEATKFTEVGYVGRDVESIIRDLVDIAVKKETKKSWEKIQDITQEYAYEKILDTILPRASEKKDKTEKKGEKENSKARQLYYKKLIKGDLDKEKIDIKLPAQKNNIEIMGPAGFDEITSQLQKIVQDIKPNKDKNRLLTIKQAIKYLKESKSNELIDQELIKEKAIELVSQKAIVFIDEIDKIIGNDQNSANVSRQGVQRDLLPLIEGCTVSTKYGLIDTDHILFIASGAFHTNKPSDLIPELQGRLPIRVELESLNEQDLFNIMSNTKFPLTAHYQEILKTEKFNLSFSKESLIKISEIAYKINSKTENIGARRLHTILEFLLEDILFEVPDTTKKHTKITADYVDEKLREISKDEDLSRYIL